MTRLFSGWSDVRTAVGAGLGVLLWLIAFPCAGESLLNSAQRLPLLLLQPYKTDQFSEYAEGPLSSAYLVNLNRNIGSWYVLGVRNRSGSEEIFNLLVARDGLTLTLDAAYPALVMEKSGVVFRCDLEKELSEVSRLNRHLKVGHIFVCSDLLLLKFAQDGHQPFLEKGAETVRQLFGESGESFISSAKDTIFQDKYLVDDPVAEGPGPGEGPAGETPLPGAAVEEKFQGATIATASMGLKPAGGESRFVAGQWYPLKNFAGLYASMIEPQMVSREILASHTDRVSPLDGVENRAVAYLMAFALDRYTLGWGHGTSHPGVGWSVRARNIPRDNPYGPDGFNRVFPLVLAGHVPPSALPYTVGTFSGGFQNRHSAFLYGEFSRTDKAHHYGFMENGVTLVSPAEGLATVLIYKDGRVDLKSWSREDQERIGDLRHFRQNGVPLIERDADGKGIPGRFVKFWGEGNWSGSADKELRTPRSAVCLIETPASRYLVYAYFSSVTPSGMARVFQAYGCRYAVHLDMNSPVQAYAAVFSQDSPGSPYRVENLATSMQEGNVSGTPRYLIKPDYKDFFYVMKKPGRE
jgi:hypothetical protein